MHMPELQPALPPHASPSARGASHTPASQVPASHGVPAEQASPNRAVGVHEPPTQAVR